MSASSTSSIASSSLLLIPAILFKLFCRPCNPPYLIRNYGVSSTNLYAPSSNVIGMANNTILSTLQFVRYIEKKAMAHTPREKVICRLIIMMSRRRPTTYYFMNV